MDLDDLDVYADGPQQNEQAVDGAVVDEEKAKPKKRRAAIRKRPKLTLEHLQKPAGLQEVFDNFPMWFQEGYRGKGHEVRDLRRLLELYQRWHPRVFPHGTYNQFESALEKMSGTHALKDALAKMRQELASKVDPPSKQDQQQDELQDQDAEQQQQQEQQWQDDPAEQNGGLGGYDDIDDDELLALQAQDAAMEAAEAAVPEAFGDRYAGHGPAPAAETQPKEDSDVHITKRTMRDWSDDDDDDDEGRGNSRLQQKQQQQSAATAGASGRTGSPAAAAAGEDDMNDMLEDMLEDDDVLHKDAPFADQADDDETANTEEADNSRKPKCSRLQRNALQDGSEDEGMEDASPSPAAAAEGELEAASQQQQPSPEEVTGVGHQPAASQQQRQRMRQWQLADDDSDDDSGGGGTAAASQQQDSADHKTQAGTQAEDGAQFAPLEPFVESVGVETADEMQLLLGTDLDSLRQHQQQ